MRAVAQGRAVLMALSAALLVACGGGGSEGPATPPPAGNPELRLTALGARLTSPWGLAVLPDGRLLVTQKGGSLVIVSADGATVSAPLTGVPAVASAGQGGLLDVALDPDFATDPWVYWTYAEPGSGGTAGTAVARGRLQGTALADVTVIFRQMPKVSGGNHFGARLAFGADRHLFVTLGERALGDPAQEIGNHLGKVLRIRRDGSVPADNPAFGAGAAPGLWSIGHRNPQGAAIHPTTGELWLTEHGPQGGDELNRVLPGRNYGWPLRSYGCNYGDPPGEACRIGRGTHAPGFEEPVSYWVPTSTAPSAMLFYTGARFPAWRGHVFIGALAGATLWRVALDGSRVLERAEVEPVKALGERIRALAQAPDGALLMLTDSGRLLRLDGV
ncbi:MAG: PQQ-dependent sugar dehydrogenase [Rubrivivax sp.]|nr:PQQ-dependent sugar dehydrogenase [Rubrivivax sp.]